MLIKERPIGYVFSVDKIVLRVDEEDGCDGCYFKYPDCKGVFPCTCVERKDNKNVILRKIYEYPEV